MFLKPKRAPSILDFASLGDAVDSALAAPRWKRTKPGPRPSPWRDAMIAAIVELETQRRGGISGRKACEMLCDDPTYHDLLISLLPHRPTLKQEGENGLKGFDAMLRTRVGIGHKGELVQLAKREHGDAWPAALIEQLLA